MSMIPRCTVCDDKLDAYGQGTRCQRCNRPCLECGRDVASCPHPLSILDLEARPNKDGGWSLVA